MIYDLTIIGAGWAGFNAAIKAKESGLKVCLADKSDIGGTCLNRGCIPTKSLVQSARIFEEIKKSKTFGIESASLPVANWSVIQERKNRIILQLKQGMQSGLHGVDFLNKEVVVLDNDHIQTDEGKFETRSILISSGSTPVELKELRFDNKRIVSSDQILNCKVIPKSLLIIGGGVIGCEFAAIFSSFGSKVCIVECMSQLLPGIDQDVAKKLEIAFKKKGIQVNTNTNALALDLNSFEIILVCVGRKPVIPAFKNIDLKTDKGKIEVDDFLKTSIPNIYAAGDCTAKCMLAHFASYQGRIAAHNIAFPNEPINAVDENIPNCVFTNPEIASVGFSEEAAKNKNISVRINKFDFLGSGMARILEEPEGFIKIISDAKTDDILGASIIGPKATELIAILTVAIKAKINTHQLKNTVLAHPTLSEGITEALN